MKAKKNILVIYPGRKGGGTVYAYEMTKGLIENGCNVYTILSNRIENKNKWEELKASNLFITTYSNKKEFLIQTVKLLMGGKRKIRKFISDIEIHACYVPMIQPWTWLILKIIRNKKSTNIITLHDPKPHLGSSKVYGWLCKKTVEIADEIIILSEHFREYTAKEYHKRKEKIHVIPHGSFSFYQSEENEKYNKYNQEYNLLFFGRITEYKGIGVLIDAYEKLRKKRKDISLTIVGNGDIEPYIKNKEIPDLLIINRWIKDEEVAGYFDTEKKLILVLPYIEATQSGVIPIGMLYKTTIIATDTGGLKEQLKNGELGVLCLPNNVDDLTEKIENTLKEYVQLEEMRVRAQKYINSLSWGNLSKKIIELTERNTTI